MLNFKKTYHSDYINFLCNKNFSKIIFCLKSEKDEYAKYVNDNSKIFYVEDIEDKVLLKEIFEKKYDLIIASKVLTKIEKISSFLVRNLKYENNYLTGDINITSPTGIKNFKDLTGKDLSIDFWNYLEKNKLK